MNGWLGWFQLGESCLGKSSVHKVYARHGENGLRPGGH
jgi:hypothetical protein